MNKIHEGKKNSFQELENKRTNALVVLVGVSLSMYSTV